jgi:hypothetical protein
LLAVYGPGSGLTLPCQYYMVPEKMTIVLPDATPVTTLSNVL